MAAFDKLKIKFLDILTILYAYAKIKFYFFKVEFSVKKIEISNLGRLNKIIATN
jgi:hypothetical protein